MQLFKFALITASWCGLSTEAKSQFLSNEMILEDLFIEKHPNQTSLGYHDGTDDRKKNISQICQQHGFGFKRYEVTTEDGYVLALDRIPPHGKSADDEFEAPVVLLQHGMNGASTHWVINAEDKSIAFILSKAGYDVWLGNNRGNMFSQKHTKLDPKKWEFWQFDFEEMGTLDQPAFIDFILNKTEGKNKIGKLAAFIGHSEGTTQFFIGSSMKPDYYKEKVNLFIAVAPIVRIDHSKVMNVIAPHYKIIEPLVKLTGTYILFEKNFFFNLAEKVCKQVPHFCLALNQGFFDFHNEIDNAARLMDKMAHTPAGACWRNVAHFAQIVANKRFQRWDFGAEENMIRYGQAMPPDYDLSKIEVPIAIAYGDLDLYGTPADVKWLVDEEQSGLRTKELMYQLKNYQFGHNTFTNEKDITWFKKDFMPIIASMCSNCLDM